MKLNALLHVNFVKSILSTNSWSYSLTFIANNSCTNSENSSALCNFAHECIQPYGEIIVKNKLMTLQTHCIIIQYINTDTHPIPSVHFFSFYSITTFYITSRPNIHHLQIYK